MNGSCQFEGFFIAGQRVGIGIDINDYSGSYTLSFWKNGARVASSTSNELIFNNKKYVVTTKYMETVDANNRIFNFEIL